MGVNQRRQIVMSAEEIARFLNEQRVATLATIAPSGQPHLVAMWYAVIDGVMWFETKAKSQKAVNLSRDSRVTVMIETGHTYDTLRGVAFEGHATIVDDPEALWAVGVSVWERYNGPYTEQARPSRFDQIGRKAAYAGGTYRGQIEALLAGSVGVSKQL